MKRFAFHRRPPPGGFITFWLTLLPTLGLAATGDYGPVPLQQPFQRELLDQAQRLGAEFRRLGLVVEEGPHAHWIEQVGARVVPPSTDAYIRYRFALLRDPTPNAFALPDGQVYVHTGTLAWLANEAQLEALIAHELSHVAGHHALVSSQVVKRRELGSAVVAGALSPVSGLVTNLMDFGSTTVTRLSLSSYSRDLEREADHHGVELLAERGLDPSAMVSLFEQLARTRAQNDSRGLALGSSHPSLRERVDLLRAAAGDASPEASAIDADFTAFVAPLSVGTVHALIEANQFHAAVELGVSLAARLPRDASVRVAAADAWRALGPLASTPRALTRGERRRLVYEMRRRSRQDRWERALKAPGGRINLATHLAEAEASYRKALALDGTFATAWRGLGAVYLQREEREAANDAYLQYLRLAPSASDTAQVRQLVATQAPVAANPLEEIVVLPPMVNTVERRIGADLARPSLAAAFEERAVAQTVASLRAAGYTVRTVSRAELAASPALREMAERAYRRFSTVRSVVAHRPRGVRRGRYALGGEASDLATALGADALLFQQLDVTAAAWGQLARAVTLSSLTFLFREVAGAARADLLLVGGSEGEVLAHYRATSRVIGKRALTNTDLAAKLSGAALRRLPAPSRWSAQVPAQVQFAGSDAPLLVPYHRAEPPVHGPLSPSP